MQRNGGVDDNHSEKRDMNMEYQQDEFEEDGRYANENKQSQSQIYKMTRAITRITTDMMSMVTSRSISR